MRKLAILLRRSNYFIVLNTVLLLGSLGIIGYLPITLLIKIGLSSAVTLYGLFIYYQQNLLKAIYHDHLGWRVKVGQAMVIGELCTDSTVTHLVSVLRFKMTGRWFKRSYVIFHDALSSHDYRLLIMHARVDQNKH